MSRNFYCIIHIFYHHNKKYQLINRPLCITKLLDCGSSMMCEISEVLLLSLLVSFLTLCPLHPPHHKLIWSFWWARSFSPVTSAIGGDSHTKQHWGSLFLSLHIAKIWATLPFNNHTWYHLPLEITEPLQVIHQSCLRLPQVLHKCYIANYHEFARQPWERQFQTVRKRIFYTLSK